MKSQFDLININIYIERYSLLQSELENIHIHRSKGAILRSKVNEVEYGEKNSKFFLNVEKNNLNVEPIDMMNREKKDKAPAMQVDFMDSICSTLVDQKVLFNLF